MNIRNLALVSLAGFTLAGCATVMNGANQDMILETEPKGAIAKLTNGFTCITPCMVELPRKHDLRVDLTLEGYRPSYVLVQSKLGGSTFGNVLAGGLVGAVVDSSSGASNKLNPNPVSVRLVPIGGTGEEMLLDKKGKETGTVAAHNDKVRVDVAKSIGAEAAGIAPPATAAAAPAPEASPAPAGN
jgi:hypothetical protein